ncbi:MAG: hypothetical protein ACYC27_21240 [Armatimonadota bacterium]
MTNNEQYYDPEEKEVIDDFLDINDHNDVGESGRKGGMMPPPSTEDEEEDIIRGEVEDMTI